MDLNALYDISYGMYVISTKYEGRNVGCFVNTISQVTSTNPIISVTVNKQNYTNEALKANSKFAVSILSEKTNPKTIGNFGFFSSRDTDKFSDTDFEYVRDLPVVTDSICGYIICEVIQIIDCETHDIFLARVIDTKKVNKFTPMTYSYYHKVIKGKVPKTAPTYKENNNSETENNSLKYKCTICGYIYDNSKEEIPFEDLPDTWVCPLCGVPKNMFEKVE